MIINKISSTLRLIRFEPLFESSRVDYREASYEPFVKLKLASFQRREVLETFNYG